MVVVVLLLCTNLPAMPLRREAWLAAWAATQLVPCHVQQAASELMLLTADAAAVLLLLWPYPVVSLDRLRGCCVSQSLVL